jgi:G:T-mismatch repair DNA endonuclease (very short patch repair protein)
MKKLSKEEILFRFMSRHGNKYSYLDNDFFLLKKTKISCSKHGIFEQTPKDHMNGRGCCLCGIKQRTKKLKKTKNQFVKEANIIHQNKYDYKSFVYINNNKKGKILCPIHGIFEQTPGNHLQKKGCAKCANSLISNKLTKSNKQFIKEANNVHNSKYEYVDTYKGNKYKIKIKCPKHDFFIQKTAHHLTGHGCPKCAFSNKSKPQVKLYKILQKYFSNKNITMESFVAKNIIGKHYRADILFPDEKFIVEYNGDYWHCNPSRYNANYFHQRKKITAQQIWNYDNRRKKELEDLGYKVFTIWESDFKNKQKNTIKDLIENISINAKIKDQ